MARRLTVTNSAAKLDMNLASFGSYCQTNFKDSVKPDRRMLAKREWSVTPLVLYVPVVLMMLVIYKHTVVCENVLILRITPSSSYLEEMKSANLVCSMGSSSGSESTGFPLSWSRAGGLPSSSIISNAKENSSGSVVYQSTLNFIPTALDNQVVFVCRAEVGPLTGTANYAPDIILIPQDPLIIAPDRADASGNYTWTCRSDGASQSAPNVYWRNGIGVPLTAGVGRATTIGTKPNKNVIYSVSITITMSSPIVVAGNLLVCTAVHSVGQYCSRKSTDQIVSLPQITKLGGDVIYTSENSTITISCVVVTSIPPVTSISWIKNGQPISLNNGRYQQMNTTAPSLTISSVNRGDQGDYVCRVTNPVGITSFITPTTLAVRYPPSIRYPENVTSFTASTGATLTIPCPVDSFPYPTSVLWYRILNNRIHILNISGDPRYNGGTIRNQQYGITINSLETNDAGIYFCVAINNIGAGAGMNITITVNSPALPADVPRLGSTAAVIFAVVSLILLIVIILGISMFCCHGKCVKWHERAKVSPFMIPSVRNYSGGLLMPPFDHETSSNVSEQDDSAILPDPRILLPQINNVEIMNSVSEMSVARALRLPPLENDTKTSGTNLRWSAHLQPPLVASNGQVFRVENDSIIFSLNQKQGFKATH